jgi:tetratricopeptide (TPR) repeat protein
MPSSKRSSGRGAIVAWLLAMLILAVPVVARADSATAEAEFREGRRLARAGRYAEACPHFEASHRAMPALGALLNLGVCHEKVGRTASAHAELRAAQEMARQRGDSREAIARELADALEPRLSRLRIVLAGPLAAGLVVRRGPVDITADLGSAIAVDPGDHDIEASAPGLTTWTVTVSVRAEGHTVDVSVPALIAPPPALVAPSLSPRRSTPLAMPRRPPSARGSWRRVAALGVGGLAVAVIGGAAAFELSGLEIYGQSEREPDDDRQLALYNDANRDHVIAQSLAIAGAGLLATSVYLVVSDPPTVDVVVGASGDATGLLVHGRF